MSQTDQVPSGPSLEVNLTEAEAIAAQLDREAVTATETTGPRRKKRMKPKKGTPENPEVIKDETAETEEPAQPKVDQDFEIMLTHGVSQGIDWMRDTMNLMEPGDTLRENVGKCIARLVSRVQPMQAGPLADAVTAAGYLAVWVLCGRIPKEKESPNI